jgi:uncharacterized surface protein with fasciclin (FAS1) repeats
MRTSLKNIGGCGWIFLVLLLGSCFKKNEAINPARSSILQFIAQTPSLSILDSAIHRVRLDTLMSSGGPFTFFAPSDSAFQAAGLTLDSINRMETAKLLGMLEYQVVNGRVSADALPGFLKQPFTSLHPLYQPFITKSYYGIFINGIGVTNGNNEMGDGIVQMTGRVAFPPLGSQWQVLEQSPDMTFFAALVNHVQALNLLVANPDPNSPYMGIGLNLSPQTPAFGNTLLVPTDSAFRAYGYPDSTSLYNDSLNVVYGYFNNSGYQSPLLAPYLLNGFVFTADLKGQITIGQATNGIGFRGPSPNAYLVTSLDGMSLTGAGIAPDNPIKITGPDIMATNGVIQKINQVFISHN